MNQTRLARTRLKQAEDDVESVRRQARSARRRLEKANRALRCVGTQVKRTEAELSKAENVVAKAKSKFAAARERVAPGKKNPKLFGGRLGRDIILARSKLRYSSCESDAGESTLTRSSPSASALRQVAVSIDPESVSPVGAHILAPTLNLATRADKMFEAGPWPECYD